MPRHASFLPRRCAGRVSRAPVGSAARPQGRAEWAGVPDLDARLRPGQPCPRLWVPPTIAEPREHDGMQLIGVLLDAVSFIVLLVVVAGMTLVPWLVDGAR